jgi:hypothetical protein
MKKILVWFFIFCIFGVLQGYAESIQYSNPRIYQLWNVNPKDTSQITSNLIVAWSWATSNLIIWWLLNSNQNGDFHFCNSHWLFLEDSVMLVSSTWNRAYFDDIEWVFKETWTLPTTLSPTIVTAAYQFQSITCTDENPNLKVQYNYVNLQNESVKLENISEKKLDRDVVLQIVIFQVVIMCFIVLMRFFYLILHPREIKKVL